MTNISTEPYCCENAQRAGRILNTLLPWRSAQILHLRLYLQREDFTQKELGRVFKVSSTTIYADQLRTIVKLLSLSFDSNPLHRQRTAKANTAIHALCLHADHSPPFVINRLQPLYPLS